MSGTRVRVDSHQRAARAAADATLHNRRVVAVLVKLAALSQGDRFAPSMLERLLTNDKKWATLLLDAIASSAFSEEGVRLSSVNAAIHTLGSRCVLSAALDTGCVLLFDELCRTESGSLKEVATHAIAVGAAAAWLAPRHGISRDPAQLAGLLHNVGSPLDWREEADKTPSADHEHAEGEPPQEGRTILPHTWHTWVGQAILNDAGLPAEYGEVALKHHDPDPEGLCLVVQVADLLAQQMGCSAAGPSPSPEQATRLLTQAKLPESDYAEVCQEVGLAVQRAARIIACRQA